jgi:hypothetical protein
MTTAAIVLAAVLAVAVVVFVARPFLLDPERRADALPDVDEAELARVRALEERDRTLAALKELEFDHRTGKISDADYRELVGPLRAEAAQALAALDRAVEPGAQGLGADPQAASSGSETTRRSGSPR